MAAVIENFGRVERKLARAVLSPADAIARFGAGMTVSRARVLPFGNGRSYGDSCLNQTGEHIDMRSMNRVLAFDREAGLVTVEPGILLADLLAHLAGTGWFVPVVPGTQLVTLGGALANDIHGKNHHLRGTFGRHVVSFELARSDGTVRTCSPSEHADLFAATIGGMGLTGIITRMTLQLMRVKAHAVRQRNVPLPSLDAYFDHIESDGDVHEYAVAWIDQLARGASFGRGILMLGDHADEEPTGHGFRMPPLAVPFQPPISALNGLSLKLFNTAFHAANSRKTEWHTASAESFFFPLDVVKNWNRLYGPRGLFQHQCVLPLETAREAVPALLKATHEAGHASFLTVLKKFGSMPSPGLISFPRAGHTLTLDFPNRGARTFALLDRLDAIVADAGGAVNPYKDARMGPAMFEQSFPGWRQLEAMRDPAIMSDFWSRTAMTLTGGAN